ncbi:hypothetical protein DPMN_128325 [Dreissena polymorpha]|uniref:Uncharacterized protein n=1 Tax=Dreissena polymorpha TaxID=45954 RepID=A0A9D4H0L4_DREPO|nr:hypothetical protein DPMN_128325 [Dreissena polymorpha]
MHSTDHSSRSRYMYQQETPRQSETVPRSPLHLQRTVSQTGGAPANDTQTVCDGAKTVCVPALDFHTVCDGARQSLRQAGHPQETPKQSVTVPR